MASIVLPNQLFPEPPEEGDLHLIEHPKFFTSQRFHVQKLILHRASMKAYQDRCGADYHEYDGAGSSLEKLFETEDRIDIYEPVDHGIKEQLQSLSEQENTELFLHETPGFLASREFNEKYFSENEYFQLAYYKEMRRKLEVLIEDGDPVGGKWSFDPENRKKMPEDEHPPEVPAFDSEHVEEARSYVEENFGGNPGDPSGFRWPVTREQARENLEDFLENRLEKFGDYQDAFEPGLDFGYHSLLSPALNIGLITPEEVVERTLEEHSERDYPMNSLEGFLRQIIGWREFVRAMYQLEPGMTDSNHWDVSNPMPEEFYTGSTGFPPVDRAVERVVENSYTHHIERLMVLGNIMLLMEIDPDEVYRWFMEMFIDAYEWVMVPNIYGMSQYAWPDMMTKPYISSSNYIGKMSHYEGGEWEEWWDSLYWSFIMNHREKIEQNSRMSVMTSHLDRFDEEKIQEIERRASELKENGFPALDDH